MITVSVRVLVPWLPGEQRQAVLRDGCSLKELMNMIGIDDGQLGSVLMVVNGRNRLLEDTLADGENVVVLPAICGG